MKMAINGSKPLLPVHSVKQPKRTRRKGSLMRIVILVVLLACVGYAAFAFRYIGNSKDRRNAHDNHILTQLNRKPHTGGGDGNEGRALKVDGEGAPELDLHGHTGGGELGSDGDDNNDNNANDTVAYDAIVSEGEAEGSLAANAADDGDDGGDFQDDGVLKVNIADAISGEQRGAKHQGTVEAGSDSVTTHTPVVAPGDHPNPVKHNVVKPVVAGLVEADRETEEKRSDVTAPSLAVGSRIESDGTAERAAVVEPGGAPQGGVKEPASQVPVHRAAPIDVDVAKIEPEAHAVGAGGKGGVKEPVPATVPSETDSSQHHVEVKEPQDKPVQAPVIAPVVSPSRTPHENSAPRTNPHASGLYALEAVDIDGKSRSLGEFAGKVTLVVNVASACGYTDENYKGLTKTYGKYHGHGLEILGFPCNQFGKQESGSEKEIKSFCTTHYHVDFPMFSKVDVNGPQTHPVYQFLKKELPVAESGGGGSGPGKDLIWNFQKILVNHEGRPIKLFYQNYDQSTVESEIYKALHVARTAGAHKQ